MKTNILEETAKYEQFVDDLTEAFKKAIVKAPVDKKQEVIEYYTKMLEHANLRLYLGTLR